jgi:hypothetical protein
MKFFALSALLAVTVAACTEARSGHASATQPSEPATCVDRDKDGFGDGCHAGGDCDDHDRQVHAGCLRCATPNEGCACAAGAQPTACFLDRTFAADGAVMCHEGTRYCRDGKWSGCESVFTYPYPERSPTALIDKNAPISQCNDCNVACYRISDDLDPVDGGLVDSGTNVAWANGGGLTLDMTPDSGVFDAGPGSVVSATPPACTIGVGEDLDCDGIPNSFDPYPNDPPFATANPSIFLQVGPGQTGTGQIDLNFFLNSADVYFLIDQSGSMADEREKLKADLTTGDFIDSESYQCADYDFDREPNNELKEKGIVGAIRCKIRDANFGTGFFREIPFGGYADADHVAFGHYSDITSDVDAVRNAIGRLTTIGNNDWPEASMVALHNVLTGNGLYFGTQRRGVPARTDCPEHAWGYPCFREDAVPIVVLFTDAQFHNGPDTNTQPYGSTSYSITAGTTNAYTAVPNTNDTFNSSANLGDLTSAYKTVSGDTTGLNADLSASLVGSACLSSSAGNDALFSFNLTQQKQVVIESTGSQFDTVLGLFTGVPGSPTDLTASTNTNEVATNALDMGDVTSGYVRVAGNTAAMAADYNWSVVSCDAATTSPDAVFKFSVTGTTQVALDTSGSSFDTVLGLYSAAPELAPAATAISNTNDDYSTAYSAGEIYNQAKVFSGDSSAATLHADYSQSQVGCGVDSTASDVAYTFTLSTPTRVRISTEGSSFDTVLGLYDSLASPVGTGSVASSAESQGSAYNVGTLDGRIVQLTGNTSGMNANYSSTQLTGCNPADAAPDTMVKFHLNEPRDVQIDTIGTSGWDTVLGLFNDSNLDPITYITTDNANETFATAKDLGTVNSKDITVTGGTTQNMHADYDVNPDITCGSSDYAPDATYRFHLDTATRVRVDLANSSFDTVLSLHNVQPGEPAVAVSNTNDTTASAIDVGDIYHQSFQRTGSTSSFAHNYDIGCNAGSTAKDAVYKFTLSQATTVQIDTVGTNFDSVLGLYKDPMVVSDPSTPSATASGTAHKLRTNAYDIGTLDDKWYRYSGSTRNMGADWSRDSSCDGDDSSPDVFFKFTLNSSRNVTITTDGSSFDTVLYLYKYTDAGLTTYSLDSCDHSNSGDESITTSLTSGTYFVVVKGDRSSDYGNYVLSVRDDAVMSSKVTCDDDSGGSKTSRITANLPAGTYNVVVSGYLSSSNGPYTIRFRDSTWWNSFGELYCHDDVSYGYRTSFIERDLDAGDYWFLIKGHSYNNKGSYALRVTDVSNTPVGPSVLSCDDNGGGGALSKIVSTALPAGDYWVVLKGKNSTSAGSYKLNIKDASATASGAIVQCDDNGGDTPGSLIERDMQAGTYQIVLKGKAAADKGAYRIAFRDVTNKPLTRLACVNDGGGGTSSYLERSLGTGTYYAVLKGNAPTDKGAYSFSLRDVTNRPLSSTTCDDDGSSYRASKITRTLDPGTYYVALKGKDANAKGPYQLSLGAGATHSSTYSPPLWSDTLQAIQSTEARVISILSCHDDPDGHGDRTNHNGDCDQTRTQAKALANASQALGASLLPLVYDIDADGTGLSTNVVGGISELAKYLEMNLTVRVLFDPDLNPGFVVTVRAIDQAGDGCDGLVGITHQHCVPGATPRFQIDFANPSSPNAVPSNPSDPNGGYNFRAELIGDNQFIVEKIPIYIIPAAEAQMGPPEPTYYPMGSYHQDSAAPGCKGNQVPDWRDLSWNADVYGNTSVTFSACTAQDAASLDTCVPHTIATISGAGACAGDADCPLGYCDTAVGVCQIATAGACSSSTQCAANAFCDSSTHLCTFNSQPVYIGPALGADNFKSFIRMSVDLRGTVPFEDPPVLHQWELTYLCNQLL